ncbi:hypothetical protein THAOC_34769 [Thalassiosira oceanica]|uniref:Uncharacterized protein n=1 Tax=Thalassiosira oceanica TaxID=159749 RepID=K0RIP4_THAOC|nr:hypothetical protein THAOC_34769 [Thalassiosira oceanica]|eukprot:EJK46557.1 hypothetical protein THAOC_34769 [Thalassiosira oceanica]
MKFVQGALVASLSTALGELAPKRGAKRRRVLDELEVDIGDPNMSMGDGTDATFLFVEEEENVTGQGVKSGKSAKKGPPKPPKAEDLIGLNDEAGYAEVARKFVGLNPINGIGGGFIIGGDSPTNPAITSPEFPVDQPDTGGPRVSLCTCDCNPSPDGIGCVGWGGVAFRYSNMVWKDPVTGDWDGMMQAHQTQDIGEGLNFMGSDRRIYPGGPVIYSVSATDNMTHKTFSGNFRQSNERISCVAGLEDKARNESSVDSSSCAHRCRNAETYTEWLDYCEAGREDKSLGFSGYGI